jgi:diguanylate cyclase (GGDEF)-like protein
VLLREVARRLLGSVRNYDYVGRSGKEEFLIVLAECAPSDLIVTAERMRAHVSEKPVDTDSGPISVTVSIGVAAQRFLDSKLPVEGELVRAAPIQLFIVLRPTAETGWRRPRKSAGVTLRVPSQLQ